MPDLGRQIKDKALELGFTQVGFAPAEPPSSAPALETWLDQGMAGEMQYLAREPYRRMDPRIYWPEARTLVVVSASYAPTGPDPEPGALEGRIARYARADDYHEIIKRKLKQLGEFIRQMSPGTRYIATVDTSAILERAHAVRAGLGFFGKNSMLLSTRHGSYTAIGVLLLDRRLSIDEPVPERCGTCRRCMDACPTGAIVAPYVVDARSCLAYLTIELRGAIPVALRPAFKHWIFGCDICQEVCPWVNRAAQRNSTTPSNPRLSGAALSNAVPEEVLPNTTTTVAGLLRPRPGRVLIDLRELALEGQDAFALRWRKSPVKRAKRAGLARNIALVLGKSPDREGATQLLVKLLDDPAPLVRGHAAWALGVQGGAVARGALERALRQETDTEARLEIERALRQETNIGARVEAARALRGETDTEARLEMEQAQDKS